jgi:hypothetical protein
MVIEENIGSLDDLCFGDGDTICHVYGKKPLHNIFGRDANVNCDKIFLLIPAITGKSGLSYTCPRLKPFAQVWSN